eukprot:comp22121_c0_seq1/m.51575 comp22121_c0_seq1/g.51575  ORF comp22121_c0_seq1/g.51575 comp22121_c0_seq1/m.51575 type:complete len:545 (-) comp22121_c0_seq1:37-1671(-)
MLRAAAHRKDNRALVWLLRSGLLRNIGGIGNKELYNRTTVGTKKLIEEYVDEVCFQLERLCKENLEGFTLEEKYFIFQDTRHAYGRSALLLSGGGALGMYHLGVIKALFEAKLLPRVISGSSVGALVAGLLATATDEELPRYFHVDGINLDVFDSLQTESTGAMQRRIKRFINDGVVMDVGKLQQWAQANMGDLTFKEAFEKTGRIVNITVSSTRDLQYPRLLNYLTAPYVLIWSAASASCAIPGIYASVELMAKDKEGRIVPYHPSKIKWSDGSVESDLPMARLSELFNVNCFIVSQVNPHVLMFLERENTRVGRFSQFVGVLEKLVVQEISFRFKQLAEFGMLPRFMSGFQTLLSQKYTGDITVIPPVSRDDFKKLLMNPTREEFTRCVRTGELAVYPLMHMIEIYLKIENTLHGCVERLKPFVKSYNFNLVSLRGNGESDLTEYETENETASTTRRSSRDESHQHPAARGNVIHAANQNGGSFLNVPVQKKLRSGGGSPIISSTVVPEHPVDHRFGGKRGGNIDADRSSIFLDNMEEATGS